MPQWKSNLREFIDRVPDLTQIDVARETGLSKNTIGMYYHSHMLRIDEGTAIALCRYFECELGDMFEIDWGVPDREWLSSEQK